MISQTLFNANLWIAGILAQEKAAPGGAPPVPAPGPGPETPPAAPAGGAGGGLKDLMLPLLLCFVVIWFIWLMPERRKQKARMAMLKGVKKGDQVVTTAGIIGKVYRVDEREVLVQVDKDSDVRMRFLKSAIHEVVPEGSEPGGTALPPATQESKS